MILMGIGGEAGPLLSDQIRAATELGWKHIEMREVQIGGQKAMNIHDIAMSDFDTVAAQLEAAGIHVYCFASAIMNWQKTIATPFGTTTTEVGRAIPRMLRLGTKFVRIMSYKPGDDESVTPPIVFRHVRDVVQSFLDAGIQPLHENCMNYGGMSYHHTLELLHECPSLKLVFDTGNPIFNPSRCNPQPWPRQDAWKLWTNVREHVAHIHIKDAVWDTVTGKETYAWPGKGNGYVCRILADALKHGYAGGISIEPHMASVFHEAQTQAPAADAARKNFVEYGRRLEQLIAIAST